MQGQRRGSGRWRSPGAIQRAPSRPLRRICGPVLAPVLLACLAVGQAGPVRGAELPATIERVTPSVVIVGTHAPLRRPPGEFRGTGFAVGDGRLVLTNAHVVPGMVDMDDDARLAVFTGRGEQVQPRRAELIASDPDHDLALLRIDGEPLPALRLGDSDRVRAGERYAFTGFPIGPVLGMHPVTHEALISAITPIAIRRDRAERLNAATLRRLADPYPVFQLDATAYPGNSGSPLYDPQDGTVVGLLNMVFVKRTKENVLQDPSGIAYAIPARHARALLEGARATGSP